MAKLKLKKGKSYYGSVSGGTILATVKDPIVTAPNEDVERLLATGYFELCDTEDLEDDKVPDNDENDETFFDAEDLAHMNVTELKEFAKEKGIDIEGLSRKTDILEAISVALGGSQAMMDIQD